MKAYLNGTTVVIALKHICSILNEEYKTEPRALIENDMTYKEFIHLIEEIEMEDPLDIQFCEVAEVTPQDSTKETIRTVENDCKVLYNMFFETDNKTFVKEKIVSYLFDTSMEEPLKKLKHHSKRKHLKSWFKDHINH